MSICAVSSLPVTFVSFVKTSEPLISLITLSQAAEKGHSPSSSSRLKSLESTLETGGWEAIRVKLREFMRNTVAKHERERAELTQRAQEAESDCQEMSSRYAMKVRELQGKIVALKRGKR